MDFPIIDPMDQDACYAELVRWLHPEGLACTDEWCGYNGLPEMGRSRAAVCHVAGE